MAYSPPSKEEILKLKLRFDRPTFKNTKVNSGLIKNKNGTLLPYSTNDSSSSCTSNYVPGSTALSIKQIYTAAQFNNSEDRPFQTPPIIAVVDYNAAVNLQSSMDTFCQNNNISSTTLNIIPIENPPSTTDGEQYADTQLIHSFCINGIILVIQAESSSIQDMAVAIEVAKTYNPNIINMSWSVNESSFSQSEFDNLSEIFTGDIIYCASSGDSGTSYVSWPASDPNVVGVGATSLVLNSNNTIKSQVTWSCSGCGPSQFAKQPLYQSLVNTGTSYRATPDISFNGNPYSGMELIINGEAETIGGSSVAAPMMSGFFASVNGYLLNIGGTLYNSISTSTDCIQTLLYSAVNQENYNTLFFDVTEGNVGQYNAKEGWDYPSGCGTIFAIPMFEYLTGYNPSGDEESSNNFDPMGEVENDSDQVQQQTSSASEIVLRPNLWPKAFARPLASQVTCIRTYIFQDGTKIEKFLDYVNKTFPNRKVDIKQLDDGKVSVSLTNILKNQEN
jgi:subtilase family serine protease